jgi:hypothetical protein
MTNEQIFKTLDEMLTDPKKRNFLNHIVRCYTPITNVRKVDITPKTFKCVLTNVNLFSLNDILDGTETEQFKIDFMNSLKSVFDANATKINPYLNIVNGKELGVTGKETTTFMSYSAFQVFYDWVITKSLKGDKHINWLLSGIKRESFLNRAEGLNNPELENTIKKLKTGGSGSAPKRTSYALGEVNDVLLNLKKQMES